jgi:hypothetical protein
VSLFSSRPAVRRGGKELKAQRKELKVKAQGNENAAQGNENPAQGNENIESIYFNRLWQNLALGAPLTLTSCGSR